MSEAGVCVGGGECNGSAMQPLCDVTSQTVGAAAESAGVALRHTAKA